MLNNISLQQIEIFLTVAEQLNVSAAARELFINQSALSRWIQRLEENLNTKLFVRNNRGVELTEDGIFLYEELQPIYEKLTIALDNIQDIYDIKRNILRICCLNSHEVIRTLSETMTAFETKHKDILVKVELQNFSTLREQITCGKTDLIVAPKIGFEGAVNISTKEIKKLDCLLSVSARGTLAESDEIPVKQLADETLYLSYIAGMTEAEMQVVKTCKSLGFTPKNICYTSNVFSLGMAVRNNKGFTIGGMDIKNRFGDEIKQYPIANPCTEQYVIAAWNNNQENQLIKKFLDSFDEPN